MVCCLMHRLRGNFPCQTDNTQIEVPRGRSNQSTQGRRQARVHVRNKIQATYNSAAYKWSREMGITTPFDIHACIWLASME